MSTDANSPNRREQPSKKPWTADPVNWLLVVVALGVVLWLAHIFMARPVAQVPPTVAVRHSLASVGPNFLENPSLGKALKGWATYDNVALMRLTLVAGGVTVVPGGVLNGVQEISQVLKRSPKANAIVRGRITISGAPLPMGSIAEILAIDSTNGQTQIFGCSHLSGVGTFPFAVYYVPNGTAHELVLAVMTGKIPGGKSVVKFDQLSLTAAKV